MNGWSYDYMLALDDVNCPKRSKVRGTKKSDIDKDVMTYAKFNLPALETYLTSKSLSWDAFCDNFEWIYTESLDVA